MMCPSLSFFCLGHGQPIAALCLKRCTRGRRADAKQRAEVQDMREEFVKQLHTSEVRREQVEVEAAQLRHALQHAVRGGLGTTTTPSRTLDDDLPCPVQCSDTGDRRARGVAGVVELSELVGVWRAAGQDGDGEAEEECFELRWSEDGKQLVGGPVVERVGGASIHVEQQFTMGDVEIWRGSPSVTAVDGRAEVEHGTALCVRFQQRYDNGVVTSWAARLERLGVGGQLRMVGGTWLLPGADGTLQVSRAFPSYTRSVLTEIYYVTSVLFISKLSMETRAGGRHVQRLARGEQRCGAPICR
jgi:hypothetical protein